jgi:hypothetical protein
MDGSTSRGVQPSMGEQKPQLEYIRGLQGQYLLKGQGHDIRTGLKRYSLIGLG